VRVGRAAQRQGPDDGRTQVARRGVAERAGQQRRRLLGGEPQVADGAQDDAPGRGLLRLHGREVAARRAMGREAPAVGDHPERGPAHVAADPVEDHVEAACGGLDGRLGPARDVVGHGRGAEGTDDGRLGLATDRAHHGGPRPHEVLEEQHPHRAGGRRHEDALAGPDVRGLEQPARRQAVVDERRGVDGRQVLGDRDQRLHPGHGPLGARARLPEPGDHAASHPPGVRRAARREHPSRDPTARHVRRAQVEEVRALARAQGRVEREDVGHLDGDQRLPGTRHGLGRLHGLEDAGIAEPHHLDRLHGRMLAVQAGLKSSPEDGAAGAPRRSRRYSTTSRSGPGSWRGAPRTVQPSRS
jgi:hypothetical protein